ncbi:MAG: hypothetical protein AAF696_22455 [Bacteroidota bacterium]
MKKYFFLILALVLFSCNSLPEAEGLQLETSLDLAPQSKEIIEDFKQINPDLQAKRKKPKNCGCTFMTEVSENLHGHDWFSIASVLVDGEIEIIKHGGLQDPPPPNPVSVYFDKVASSQNVPVHLGIAYSSPLDEDGWIKQTIYCNQLPWASYTQIIPAVYHTNLLSNRKIFRITSDCGTPPFDDF